MDWPTPRAVVSIGCPLGAASRAFASLLGERETAKMAIPSQSLSRVEGDTPGPIEGRPRQKQLRVLHVINYLGRGGTEYGVLKLIAGLGNGSLEHRICTTRGFDPDFASLQRLQNNLFVAGRPGEGFQFPLFRLVRIMQQYRPHIVHSRNWGTIEAIPAARLAGVPVAIHSEHGYDLSTLGGLPYRRRLMSRAVYEMADAVFAVTSDLRAYHANQAWVSPDKIRVIHNGVDIQRFSPRPELRGRVRRTLGLTEESLVIGTVGRLAPIKDHMTLLRATEILRRQGFHVCTLIVGSGSELSKLKSYAAASPYLAGHVYFPGTSENVSELLNAMDIFTLTSLGEGMSNTLLEAMASGLAVIATRAGGNPELVQEDRTGWLFPAGDEQGLAEHLRRLVCDRETRLRFGAAARQWAVEHFDLKEMLRKYSELYFELAARRRILESS